MAVLYKLNDQWTIWADKESQELSLLNRETGETVYIPWAVIDELRPVQGLSQDSRETPELFHGASTQDADS